MLTLTRSPDWVPPGTDDTVPSAARIYDYMLGGGHNFAVDREAATKAERIMPHARGVARLNRAFLRRAVRFMVDQGVRQFLDIGSGVPTVGNVHEIAQEADPECRVVYVDHDPVAVAHSRLILDGNDRTTALKADARDPSRILGDSQLRRQLDLDEPIGMLFLCMLHWLPDESDPGGLMRHYIDAMASESYLAITHITEDYLPYQVREALRIATRGGDQVTSRPYDEVLTMFGDLELLEPGLVGCGTWRPAGPGDIAEDPTLNQVLYAGMARKS
ncbi:S-adenosyl methyltransferase [Amycolatopsis lurida]|uniref:SAM-dependent methyltransferase n=1 Tax=Amycolatopsis lurida TaxID=31959 RepID=UPI000894D670|nr:SAM-dependent methyltransferase [Amycolatopsis lurida]SED05896.1 S-adenosyl methyltransferase [Amycolatopsis lurida]